MDLLRKQKIQKKLSPDQLDQLIQITNSKDWIALLGICSILVVFIIWSIWGTISINLPGSGLLIRPGGYRIIETPIEGQISKITPFETGDVIQAGQVIAEFSQPLLRLQVQAAKTQLAELLSQAASMSEQLKTSSQIQLKIIDAQTQLKTLEDKLQVNTYVMSPYSGSFLEMRASKGIYLKPGDSLLSMEDVGGKISAVLFLPPSTTNIRAIKPGMLAKVFPGLEKDTERGYLLGVVRHISKFPVSPQIMMNILHNDYLVKYFSQSGPPYLISIELMLDPKNLKQYEWVSTAGNETPVTSGDFCSVLIQIANKPPIEFLIPMFKKYKKNFEF